MLYPKLPSGRRTMSEKDTEFPNRNEGIEQDKAPDTKSVGNHPAAGNMPRVAELHFPARDVEKTQEEKGVPASLVTPEQSPAPAGKEERDVEIHNEATSPTSNNMEHLHVERDHLPEASTPALSGRAKEEEAPTIPIREVPSPESAEKTCTTSEEAEAVTPAKPLSEAAGENVTIEGTQIESTPAGLEAERETPAEETPVSLPQDVASEADESHEESGIEKRSEEALPADAKADEEAAEIIRTSEVEQDAVASGLDTTGMHAGEADESEALANAEHSARDQKAEPAGAEKKDAAVTLNAEEDHEEFPGEIVSGTLGEELPAAQDVESSVAEEASEPAEVPLEPVSSIPGMAIPPAVVTPGALATESLCDEELSEEVSENAEPAGKENIGNGVPPADNPESAEETPATGTEEEVTPEEKTPAPEEPAGQAEPVEAVAGQESAVPVEAEELLAPENVNEEPEEPPPIEENVEQQEQIGQDMHAVEASDLTVTEDAKEVAEEPLPIEENAGQEDRIEQEVPAPELAVPAAVDGEGIVSGEETGGDEEPEVREEVVDDLAHIIESIIFASDEPLPVSTIKSVLDAAHTFGRVNPDMITSRVNALNAKYEADGTGFHIVEIANGYQYATRKEMAQWVSNLFKERSKRRLSNSALETVAIIAYKQPITKPEIESIRGVNVDYVLHNLLEKELVTVVGRAETVGRPLLYGTTQKFMKVFALKSLDDLPKLREIEEIIKEIKSKGAEESIQLEITALGDSSSMEPASGGNIIPEAPSENGAE